MRVVFMGTPEFAVPSLRALAGSHELLAVYTRPDAASGRGSARRPSPVAQAAEELGVAVRQPASLRDEAESASLADLRADLVVVAAYGLILPPPALSAAALGAVNVHASLLPRWRGAAPVQRAILAGDTDTGVSIMRVEEGLDTGPYYLQLSTPVAEKTARELTAELAELGAIALARALPAIADGTALWTPQDESLVTYAEKVSKGDVAVGPELSCGEFARRVRASMPAAPSRALVAGRGVTLLDARASDIGPAGSAAAAPPGSVTITKSAVLLGCVDGVVEVVRLKPDGKAEMSAVDWARGVRGLDAATWESAR